MELEKVKKRRMEREHERAEMEREREMLQRDKEAEYHSLWEKQEDNVSNSSVCGSSLSHNHILCL